jgi:NAD-dependent dihydropyrimidine dehydrogenase PreA subunit
LKYQRPVERRHGTKYITLNTRKCKACWECVESCPNNVIGRINLPFHKHARISEPENCKGCLRCVEVCLQQAIIPDKSISHQNQEITM